MLNSADCCYSPRELVTRGGASACSPQEPQESAFLEKRGDMTWRSACPLVWAAIISMLLLAPTTTESVTPASNHSKKLGPLSAGLLASSAIANASVSSAENLVEAPELRYRILERFKPVFFCDPDAFPVALSPALVRKRGLAVFSEIEKDRGTFRAIVDHRGLTDTEALSDEQKLLVYGEFKKLRSAVHLEKVGRSV